MWLKWKCQKCVPFWDSGDESDSWLIQVVGWIHFFILGPRSSFSFWPQLWCWSLLLAAACVPSYAFLYSRSGLSLFHTWNSASAFWGMLGQVLCFDQIGPTQIIQFNHPILWFITLLHLQSPNGISHNMTYLQFQWLRPEQHPRVGYDWMDGLESLFTTLVFVLVPTT